MRGVLQSSSAEVTYFLDKAWEAKDNREKRLGIARMPFEQIVNELNNIDNDRKTVEQLRGLLIQLAVSIKMESETLPLEITTLPVLSTLYRLGTMSFPHEAFTRYPDDEKMIPIEYVRELGIVKALPKMTKYLVIALKELRHELAQTK